MWPAFLIGLLSEFFSESKELSKLVVKGFASAIVGLILNFVLLLLLSGSAAYLIGYEILTLYDVSAEFVLTPFVAAFIALTIVKVARYFSNWS
jgi:hypothetical protein